MIRTITTLCLALFALPAMAQAPTTLTVGNLAPRLADAKAKACPGAPVITARRVADVYAEITAIATCPRSPAPAMDLAPVLSAIDALPERIAQRIGQPTTPAGPKAIIDLDFAKVGVVPDGSATALEVPTLSGRRFQNNATSIYTDPWAYPDAPASYVQSASGIALKIVRTPVTATQHDGQTRTLPWASAWLSTRGMPAVRVGDTISFKLRVPKTQGTVPAVWLTPVDGSWPPEVDLLEFFQKNDGTTKVNTTQITRRELWQIDRNFYLTNSMPAGFDQAAWHTYTFTTSDGRLRGTVDSKTFYDQPLIVPDTPMQLVFSNTVAMGDVGEPAASVKDAVVAEMAWLKVTR